jgi:hypothetical protein
MKKEKKAMRQSLLPGIRVLVSVLFFVGMMCPGDVPSTVVTADTAALAGPSIEITFRGLMVFDKRVQSMGQTGTQTIWLHDGATHHKLSIQIKGPGFGDFLEWGHSYGQDLSLKLEVTGAPRAPEWRSGKMPHQIAGLHSSDGLGDLVMQPDKFGSTLTINAGDFYSETGDEAQIEFSRPGSSRPYSVPKVVKARIILQANQTAQLTGGSDLKTISMEPSEAWEIVVRNNPDLGSVCDYPHFKYYYDGFVFVKDGRESPVPAEKKYEARLPNATECYTGKVVDRRAIETRPCIPISH